MFGCCTCANEGQAIRREVTVDECVKLENVDIAIVEEPPAEPEAAPIEEPAVEPEAAPENPKVEELPVPETKVVTQQTPLTVSVPCNVDLAIDASKELLIVKTSGDGADNSGLLHLDKIVSVNGDATDMLKRLNDRSEAIELTIHRPSEISITIVRKAEQKFGASISAYCGISLQVAGILASGVFQDFNKANPDNQIMVSDFIVKVNGISSDSAKLLTEMQNGETLNLVIARHVVTGGLLAA